MKLHEWKPSFETGNEKIDAQHRGLVRSLNIIFTFSNEGKGALAFAECMAFRKLAEKHFDEEVEILREAEFPRLETHAREHMNLLGKFDEIFSVCCMVCKEGVPCPYMEDLSFLTVDHLVRHDLDYKSHLQVKNLADGGA